MQDFSEHKDQIGAITSQLVDDTWKQDCSFKQCNRFCAYFEAQYFIIAAKYFLEYYDALGFALEPPIQTFLNEVKVSTGDVLFWSSKSRHFLQEKFVHSFKLRWAYIA